MIRQRVRFLLPVALAALAAGALAGLSCAHDGFCRYGDPRPLARIADRRLKECSGLAASRRHAGIFWAHCDSGDSPRLFALDTQGHTRAVVRVPGAAARDWEDIAAGPGPDGRPSLYIGDFGNNLRRRQDLTVYCIPEPDLPAGATELDAEPAQAFAFRYPDGNFDTEALMLHPQSGDLYVIPKRPETRVGIYRFPRPLQPGKEAVLERAGTLRLEEPLLYGRLVTGADIAPDGRRCVVRTYTAVLEWRVPEGGAFLDAFASRPARLPAPAEIQGEAIAYQADGHGLVTASEGRRAPVYLIPCAGLECWSVGVLE